MNPKALGLFAALSMAGCSDQSAPPPAGTRRFELLYTNDLDGEIEPCG